MRALDQVTFSHLSSAGIHLAKCIERAIIQVISQTGSKVMLCMRLLQKVLHHAHRTRKRVFRKSQLFAGNTWALMHHTSCILSYHLYLSSLNCEQISYLYFAGMDAVDTPIYAKQYPTVTINFMHHCFPCSSILWVRVQVRKPCRPIFDLSWFP